MKTCRNSLQEFKRNHSCREICREINKGEQSNHKHDYVNAIIFMGRGEGFVMMTNDADIIPYDTIKLLLFYDRYYRDSSLRTGMNWFLGIEIQVR